MNAHNHTPIYSLNEINMTRPVHRHPDECLPYLDFQCHDGGRNDYFDKFLNIEVPKDIQDCSVIAISLASGFNPEVKSPALSYNGALLALEDANRRLKPWKCRRCDESRWEFLKRRRKEIMSSLQRSGTPEHMNPIYGTDTNVYSYYLESKCNYNLVFGRTIQNKAFLPL